MVEVAANAVGAFVGGCIAFIVAWWTIRRERRNDLLELRAQHALDVLAAQIQQAQQAMLRRAEQLAAALAAEHGREVDLRFKLTRPDDLANQIDETIVLRMKASLVIDNGILEQVRRCDTLIGAMHHAALDEIDQLLSEIDGAVSDLRDDLRSHLGLEPLDERVAGGTGLRQGWRMLTTALTAE